MSRPVLLVLGMALLGAVAAAVVTFWPESSSDELVAVVPVRFPLAEHPPAASVHTLGSIEELVAEASLVVEATANARRYKTSDEAVDPLGDMFPVTIEYELQVHEYLKGRSSDRLTLRKVIGYDYESEEVSFLIDDTVPLADGARYLLFLRSREDGLVSLVAEPGRFRIESGVARAETTILGFGESDVATLVFPERTTIGLRSQIIEQVELAAND